MNVVSRSACWSKRIALFALAMLVVVMWPKYSFAQQNSIKLFSSTLVQPSASGASFTNMTVINSTTLSLSCPAEPTATLSNTADGLGNVLVDNYMTLSINGNPVGPIEGAFSPAGNVCTGGVTDGFNNTTQQDCFSQAYRNAAVSGGINGVDSDSITNANNNNYTGGQPGGVPPINIGSYLPASTTSQVSIQLLDAGGYVASSSLYIVTNCTRAADVTQTIPTTDTSNVNLVADFTQPGGATLTTNIDYLAPNGLQTAANVPNPVLVTTNSEVPSGVWPQYVVGTPFAPSHCTVKLANGGSMLCSLFINACYQAGADASTASDANCPVIANPDANNYIVLQDTFDWGDGKWIPTPGYTASLIAFSVPATNPGLLWSPSMTSTNPVCPTQILNSILPCYLTDSLVDISGDQTTTRGTSPKTKAWLASAVDVPMLYTSVNLTAPQNSGVTCASMLNNPPTNNNGFAASIWSNSACLLSLVVNPAIGSGNYFQAAQPSFLEYGFASGIVAPPPITPGTLPDGDQKVTGSSALTCDNIQPACYATAWPAVSGVPLSTFFNATDGTFTLHWSAKDAAGVNEKNITLLDESNSPCTVEEAQGTICNYFTNYFTTTVNLDSTKPTVATFSFSPAGGTYVVGQPNVTANFTCADPLNNGVASGVASCTAVTDTNNVPFATGGGISTATVGPHSVTVTAVDNAGNQYSQVYSYTVTQPPSADVAIYEGYSYDVVKHGTTYNYPAWTLDLTKGVAAQGVTVKGTVTIPTSSLAGNISAKVAVVSCSLSSGCSAMSIGSACSLTGSSVSGSNTIQTVSCNVGTLQSVYNLQGARVQLMIPVSSTAKLYSTFRIDAVVSSANDPNAKNNAVCDIITVK